MKLLVLLLLAASPLHFDIADGRGKHPSGVAIDATERDADGWYQLHVTAKSKTPFVLIWPYDGRAKTPDGPEPIPAIVIQAGDPKALENPRVVAAMAAGILLGSAASQPPDIDKAIAGLVNSEDAFVKGVALLCAKKPVDAIDPLARALRERERQLTQIVADRVSRAGAAGFTVDELIEELRGLAQEPTRRR